MGEGVREGRLGQQVGGGGGEGGAAGAAGGWGRG